MADNRLHDLIDQYLLGTISSEDHQVLQQHIATDPDVARMVEESKLAYKALEQERRKQLKTKLKGLDEIASGTGSTKFKWFGPLIFLCVACFFYFYMSSFYFNPGRVAERNYISYQTFSVDHPEIIIKAVEWQLADVAFSHGEFEKAIHQFAILTESSSPYESAAANWNILIAQLALEGPVVQWKLKLEAFEKSAPEEFSLKAKALRKCLESAYYKFFLFRFQDNLSSIKPRLI